MNSRRLVVNGHHYEALITGDGEPILLLHGFSGDKSTWHDLCPAFQGDNQVIAIDLPGHGASAKPPAAGVYQMDQVAADVICLLDKLNVFQCHVVGYSMGGRLALYLALHYSAPFQSLILESASPGLDDPQERNQRRRLDNQLANKIEMKGIEWFVDYWQGLPIWDSQRALCADLLLKQRLQRLRNDPHGLANSLRGMGAGAQPSLWQHLPQLSVPTLLLAGEHDHKFLAVNQQMAGEIPRAQLAVVPGAGHNTHLEQPDTFRRQVHSFLQNL